MLNNKKPIEFQMYKNGVLIKTLRQLVQELNIVDKYIESDYFFHTK